jgi:type II secretory pathway predicted ATPase ExeA
MALLLSACSPSASATVAVNRAALEVAASSGVCQAMVALPDASASERAFTNLAHEALHGLADDPRLARPISARVLEAMQRIEADFRGSASVAVMTDDLEDLRVATDAALVALGVDVPACSA